MWRLLDARARHHRDGGQGGRGRAPAANAGRDRRRRRSALQLSRARDSATGWGDVVNIAETSVYDDAIFYRLFAEAELVRWKMGEYPWSSIHKSEVSPAWIEVARQTLIGELTTFSATERFFADFGGDVDFTQWLTVWLYEETKHPSALLIWLDTLGHKFDSRFMLQGRETLPFMPSKMGTLATNIISEMVAATICRNIGGDEARHAASFYSYAKKSLASSENPTQDKLMALKVLYFWTTPELNARVGHPVNMLANRYQSMPELQDAVPGEAIRSAVENTYKRSCRVFETLLGLELRDVKDVSDQLAALQSELMDDRR
jgi:hypothetical protein